MYGHGNSQPDCVPAIQREEGADAAAGEEEQSKNVVISSRRSYGLVLQG